MQHHSSPHLEFAGQRPVVYQLGEKVVNCLLAVRDWDVRDNGGHLSREELDGLRAHDPHWPRQGPALTPMP